MVDLMNDEIVFGGHLQFIFSKQFKQGVDCDDNLNEVKFILNKLFD